MWVPPLYPSKLPASRAMNWMGDQPRIYCLEDSYIYLSFFFFSYLSLFYWPLLFLNEYSKTYSVSLRPPEGKERGKCACKPNRYNELKLVFNLSAWESAEFIVGLPQLKDRYFRDISNVLTVTSRDETHFRHTKSTEANLSACKVKRNTYVFYLHFRSYFETKGPNHFYFLCKILQPWKSNSKSLSWSL